MDNASTFTTRINPPGNFTSAELDAFEALVCDADEVSPNGLRQRISNASHLLFLYDSSGTLTGVSALKHPDSGYRAKVFQRAHASTSPASYPVELGWVVVASTHRGKHFSRPLVEGLLPKARGKLVYATTRADNERMQHTLIRYGFRQDGAAYRSTRGDYALVLFVQQSNEPLSRSTSSARHGSVLDC